MDAIHEFMYTSPMGQERIAFLKEQGLYPSDELARQFQEIYEMPIVTQDQLKIGDYLYPDGDHVRRITKHGIAFTSRIGTGFYHHKNSGNLYQVITKEQWKVLAVHQKEFGIWLYLDASI